MKLGGSRLSAGPCCAAKNKMADTPGPEPTCLTRDFLSWMVCNGNALQSRIIAAGPSNVRFRMIAPDLCRKKPGKHGNMSFKRMRKPRYTVSGFACMQRACLRPSYLTSCAFSVLMVHIYACVVESPGIPCVPAALQRVYRSFLEQRLFKKGRLGELKIKTGDRE